jgi:hypothetical protein
MFVMGKVKSSFQSPYSLETCVSKIRLINSSKSGILSTRSRIWSEHEKIYNFSISLQFTLRVISKLDGVLVYLDEKSTQVKFVSFLSPLLTLIIIVGFVFITIIGVSYWFSGKPQLLPIVGIILIFHLLVSLYWIVFPQILGNLVKEALS